MTTDAPLAPRVAIGALSAVVLLVQIAATRLLSATVAYHAAFAILALVMLAFAASAAAVYRDRTLHSGTEHSLLPAATFAVRAGPILVATGLTYLVVGAIPWSQDLYDGMHVLAAAVGLYASFYACGYGVAWLLASWPRDLGRVYFADLFGASLGCLVAVPVLARANPVQILIGCGLVATLSGLLIGWRESAYARRHAWIAAALAVAAAVSLGAPSLVRLRSAKVQDQSSVLFEQWNQLARVTVSPEVPGTLQAIAVLQRTLPRAEAEAVVRTWTAGWAMSERWHGTVPKMLWIQLDSDAGTGILEGGGTRPLSDFDVLRWDATAAAYWLRPGRLQQVFVIGGGGGRDFLTALSFGAERVDVVELNPLVVRAVENEFGDFSGRPYSRAGVHYRLGDARSELSRSSARYDLIQMSMIDTWAASMSGALTLSENALYTREAFRMYLEHLADDGMLTVSRWYWEDRYGETARVLSLMADGLRSSGVTDPVSHVALVINAGHRGASVATCIMKRSAFTAAERDALVELGRRAGFGMLWPEIPSVTSHHPMDVAAILSAEQASSLGGKYDLLPPSDDRPFFFNTTRLLHLTGAEGAGTPLIFVALTAIILVVGHVLVVAPLRQVEASRPVEDRISLRRALPELTYFAAVGASFMGVELGVLQRYIVFLGHPTYALSVVLFSLLLSTALGSFAVGRRPGLARLAFPLLLAALAVTTFGVPLLLDAWHSWPLANRLTGAAALIVPLGMCMGVAFPSGVHALVGNGDERLVPWMWAINGLAGTLASVVGMFLAMQMGYTALLLASTAGYVIAWAALHTFGRADRRARRAARSAL